MKSAKFLETVVEYIIRLLTVDNKNVLSIKMASIIQL